MIEVTEIKEIDDKDVNRITANAVDESVKQLEETMAVEGIAPMIVRQCGKSLADCVSDVEDPAPSDPVHPIPELMTEIDVEGVGVVEVPTMPVGKSTTKTGNTTKKTGTKVFDSGLKVIKANSEKIPIKLPAKICLVCNSLQRKVENNEFSIVCKGTWDDGEFIVSDDFKVPRQEVAGASVDYDLEHLEELKRDGYNTIIHSHPFKSSNFSHDDDTTINSHFECSVLYSVGEFTTATVAITSPAHSGMKFVLVGDPKIDGDDGIVPETESSNIEKKYSTPYVNPYYNGVDYKYGGYNGLREWDEDGVYQSNLGSRNVGRNIGSDPDECDKEYDKSLKDKERFRKKDKFLEDVGKIRTANFDYDVGADNLSRKDKRHMNKSARGNAIESTRVIPVKVHHGCGCGCGTHDVGKVVSSKVFRTEEVHADQETGVFKADAPKNKDTIRQRGKKKP
jgi:hypothetical protein